MGREWENPGYEYECYRRRRSLAILAVFLLAVISVAATVLIRRGRGAAVARLEATAAPPRISDIPGSSPRPSSLPLVETRGGAAPEASLPADGVDPGPEQPAAIVGRPGDFDALKALAFSLYRQNNLEAALAQAQAALALHTDGELLELQAKLKREILVQRDYDGARTANFTVLFDGYEHEEMKTTVLGILKDAYADIGKELDHFPEEPITVILYTGKDFSDVTRAPAWSGGTFGKVDGKIRVPVHGAEGQDQALRRVLTHEYVHALLHSRAPDTPIWLHEGLAQYLCGDGADGVSQLIPLPMLEQGFPRDARLARAAYAESLQAVADLVDEHGMTRLRRLLNELGTGKEMESAFTAAYGEPFSRWADQWRPVVRGDSGEEGADQEKKEEEE